MVTAAQRRRAVDHLKEHRVNERRACRLVGLSRSVAWYRLKGCDDGALRARLKVLAERYPRYGYPTLHDLLKEEGRVINSQRTYRIYREEGLQVRTKRGGVRFFVCESFQLINHPAYTVHRTGLRTGLSPLPRR